MLLVIQKHFGLFPGSIRQERSSNEKGRGEELLNSKNLIVYGAQIN